MTTQMDALVRAAFGLEAPDQEQAQQSAATPDPEAQDDACPICLESLSETGATMLTTSCGHQFCASCLRAATTRSAACPLCRGRAHACLEKNRAACALCRADIPSIKEVMMMHSAASARTNARARCSSVWVVLLTVLSVLLLIYLSCAEMCPERQAFDVLYSAPFWAIVCISIFISVLNILHGTVCCSLQQPYAQQQAYTAALSQGARSRVAPEVLETASPRGDGTGSPVGPSPTHGRPQLPV